MANEPSGHREPAVPFMAWLLGLQRLDKMLPGKNMLHFGPQGSLCSHAGSEADTCFPFDFAAMTTPEECVTSFSFCEPPFVSYRQLWNCGSCICSSQQLLLDPVSADGILQRTGMAAAPTPIVLSWPYPS
ncbi:hypothetical protein Y1Q_0016836 [Alligator mississippiensis]|uniref:Uncharacterized protein n=1 Tax=Alligator mississippiensis TaxID=8496 RepID=A0A151P6L7_ALLMI|nr:hypothetical protein Y1Q_0016836 [Alligator mississippiensis]